MLVLYSDYSQLVEAHGRFQNALSCSNDARREAAAAQHQSTAIHTSKDISEFNAEAA